MRFIVISVFGESENIPGIGATVEPGMAWIDVSEISAAMGQIAYPFQLPAPVAQSNLSDIEDLIHSLLFTAVWFVCGIQDDLYS